MTSSNYIINGLLGWGLVVTIIGLIEFKTVFTFKFSLAPISGTINNVKTYVSTVSSKGHKSQKSELIFHLRGHNQQFELSRNIGDGIIDEEYESWCKVLEKADSVKIWVRESEIRDYQPQIFQIEADNEILLAHETVRQGPALLAFSMTILGLGSLLLFSFLKFPHKMKKLFRIDKPDTNS